MFCFLQLERSCFVLFVEIGNRGASFWLVGIGKKLFVFFEEGMSITDGAIGFE